MMITKRCIPKLYIHERYYSSTIHQVKCIREYTIEYEDEYNEGFQSNYLITKRFVYEIQKCLLKGREYININTIYFISDKPTKMLCYKKN